MGRNRKSGLDYFPFDVDFFSELKIRKLIKCQGGKAVTVYALLLCNIYKQGYYMRWDEELPFIISEQTGYDEVYIQEVIKSCFGVGLFSKELYDQEKIITSKGIQERYQTICSLSRRVCEIKEYDLISSEVIAISSEEKPITSEEKGISSEEKPISSAKSTQRKVKERKENISPSIPQSGDAVATAPDTSEQPVSNVKDKTWRDDYKIYLELVREAFWAIRDDKVMLEKQQSYYPNVDLMKSLEKACTNFWATDAGWMRKKKTKSKDIDMKMTLINAINLNRVFKNETETTKRYDSGDFLK